MAQKPNFSSLLSMPAGEAKKPEAIEAGNYPGIIKTIEYGDANKNKTPYVRFNIALTGWADSVEPPDGMTLEMLSKRTFRRDYYLTQDALWRLDELLRACEIDCSGRKYEETIPEMVGKRMICSVEQYLNNENETGNRMGNIAPQN